MRYVVVSQIEDAVRVFGTYSDHERAQALAAKVNAEVELREESEFAAWEDRYQRGEVTYGYEMAPSGHGRAHVYIVHTPRYREALAFALTGNSDPAYAKKGAI